MTKNKKAGMTVVKEVGMTVIRVRDDSSERGWDGGQLYKVGFLIF